MTHICNNKPFLLIWLLRCTTSTNLRVGTRKMVTCSSLKLPSCPSWSKLANVASSSRCLSASACREWNPDTCILTQRFVLTLRCWLTSEGRDIVKSSVVVSGLYSISLAAIAERIFTEIGLVPSTTQILVNLKSDFAPGESLRLPMLAHEHGVTLLTLPHFCPRGLSQTLQRRQALQPLQLHIPVSCKVCFSKSKVFECGQSRIEVPEILVNALIHATAQDWSPES